jgi:hypothetical protein
VERQLFLFFLGWGGGAAVAGQLGRGMQVAADDCTQVWWRSCTVASERVLVHQSTPPA